MRAILLVAFVPVLCAQPPTKDRWAELRAKNPAGFQASLQLTAPHPFHLSELIQTQVNLEDIAPGSRQGPVPEKWQFGGFLLSPQVECGSLQKPCLLLGNGPFVAHLPGMDISQRGPTSLILNDYIPLLQPGRYSAAIILRKLVLKDTGPLSTAYGYPDPPQLAVTNAIEFVVIPSSRAWIQQTVAAVITTLKNADSQAYEARGMASKQLSFLGESDAWRTASARLPLDEGTLMQGLAAGNQADWVCDLLQARIPRPDQSITFDYFNTMVQVCTQSHVPQPPAPATTRRPLEARISASPPVASAVLQPSADQQAYFEKVRTYRDDFVKKPAAALAASLSQKQPGPLADAFNTLLDQLQQSRNSRQPPPEWAAGLTQEFIRLSNQMDAGRYSQLLSAFASISPSPELVPLFESILDNHKPDDLAGPENALQVLYKLDRPKAEARILAELVNPRTWLDMHLLEFLPASSVPPMDDALIEALVQSRRLKFWNPQVSMAAVAKYATPAAAPRIKAIYESQPQDCQPELLAYFVRVDPAYADGVFHSHPWDMRVDPPRCALQYFQRTALLAMSPELERFMAAYLGHVNVFVKTTSARTLELYGSKSAVGPLWEAFRYFHEYWKDQRAQLPPTGEGAQLEMALRNAIARGHHWLADEADLRAMESLCITGQCLYETRDDLEAWRQRPLRLQLSTSGSGIHAGVAQYYGLDSLEAINEKLAQFPTGTRFVVSASGDDAAGKIAAVRQFAEGQGLILTESR